MSSSRIPSSAPKPKAASFLNNTAYDNLHNLVAFMQTTPEFKEADIVLVNPTPADSSSILPLSIAGSYTLFNVNDQYFHMQNMPWLYKSVVSGFTTFPTFVDKAAYSYIVYRDEHDTHRYLRLKKCVDSGQSAHKSLAGKEDTSVIAAGELYIVKGKIAHINTKSGTYYPGPNTTFTSNKINAFAKTGADPVKDFFKQVLENDPRIYFEYHGEMDDAALAAWKEEYYIDKKSEESSLSSLNLLQFESGTESTSDSLTPSRAPSSDSLTPSRTPSSSCAHLLDILSLDSSRSSDELSFDLSASNENLALDFSTSNEELPVPTFSSPFSLFRNKRKEQSEQRQEGGNDDTCDVKRIKSNPKY